jgi:DUF4097 and DUF4098 domain-containing protein YvlB
MKNKNWGKIAWVLILVGAMLCIIGWLMGFRGGSVFFENGRLTVHRSEGTHTPLSFSDSQEINHIIINTTMASVIIEPLRHGSPGVTLTNLEPNVLSIENGTLTINTRLSERRIYFFNFGFNNNSTRREIRIHLPADANLSQLEINCTSGTVRINDISAERINAVVTSGSIRAENITFNEGILRSTSGSVNLTNARWQNLRANSTSGSVRIADGEIIDISAHGETILNAVSGSVNLEIRGTREHFNYSLSTGSGTARINGENQRGGTHVNHFDANHSISMSASSGSTRLNFN